jgi:hypothetical protein
VVDAPNIIAEVAQLETSLSLYLHLMKVPFHKTLNYNNTVGKTIYWPRVDRVTYRWRSCDVVDKSGSHLNNQKEIATPMMQVGVKLPHYLLHLRAVIFYHFCPSLGI